MLLAAHGYNRWLYASANPYGKTGFPATLANEFGSWMLEYMVKGYQKVDPIVLHCRASTEPLLWDAGAGWEGAESMVHQLMRDVMANGFGSGLAIPLSGPGNGRPQGVFNVTDSAPLSESRDRFDALMPRLVLVGQALHQAMSKILKEAARFHDELT